MATIKIKTRDGSEAGALELNDEVFGAEINELCVRIALNQHMANQRAGTHSTKTRGMVRGGGRKPWRQKGTGRARQGSIRSAQWRGGSIIFGPHPRDYSYRINKKVKRAAFRSILTEFAKSGRLIAIDDFGLTDPKTSAADQIFKAIGVKDGMALVLTERDDRNLMLSARNLPYVNLISVDAPNIFDLLTHDYLIARPSALKRLEGAFA